MLFQIISWCSAKPPKWLKYRMSTDGYVDLTGDDIFQLLDDCPVMLIPADDNQPSGVAKLYIEEPGHRFTQR